MATSGRIFIGLDVGTQSTKGVLLDTAKSGAQAIVGRASEPYELLADLPPGAAEQHPHTWRDAVKKVVSDLLKDVDPDRIGGIGVSGQQHGLVALDGEDQVIRPAKLWCDTTTSSEAARISERSRWAVPAGYTLPKLLWMKENEPENFERVQQVLLPHDYVNFLLSGEKFMEAGDASGTGAFDPESRSFDEELLKWIDPRAPEFFPRIVAPNRPAGRVNARAAMEFGLPEGIVVAPGGGDNMMSAIGSGATRAGSTVMSLGTSGTVFAYSDSPVLDPEGSIAAFCDSTGAWLPLLCTMNVTGVTEEVRQGYALDHEAITLLAETVPAGCDGLSMLPYLQGERVPNLPDAFGALLGIRPGLMEPGRLYRAAMEGATLGLVSGIQRMKDLGLTVDRVRLVGGGSKNRLWRQIVADAVGVPVQVLVEPESAALGAAIQAAWVDRCSANEEVGIDQVAEPFIEIAARVEPNANNASVYEQARQALEKNTRALFPS